jgi:hypothetical protein
MKKCALVGVLLLLIFGNVWSQGQPSGDDKINGGHMHISEYCYICGRTNEEITEYLILGFYEAIQGSIDIANEVKDNALMQIAGVEEGVILFRRAIEKLPQTILRFKYETIVNEKDVFMEDYPILKDIFELPAGYFQGVDKSLAALDYFQRHIDNEDRYKERYVANLAEAEEKINYYNEQKELRSKEMREQNRTYC